MKRLTQKEEEAYGLYFHGTEKLNPGVMLRSQQKLPGLNQRQSILKSVNILLQEMDIPTEAVLLETNNAYQENHGKIRRINSVSRNFT